MGALSPTPFQAGEDLVALGIATPEDIARFTGYFHQGDRELIVISSMDVFSLDEAFRTQFSIRRWAHASVSVRGALKVRLADQNKIGRQRNGGERTPAPLPDWYELTHIAYEHAVELGFDRERAVWQYLPAANENRLNVAEALHLRQPM